MKSAPVIALLGVVAALTAGVGATPQATPGSIDGGAHETRAQSVVSTGSSGGPARAAGRVDEPAIFYRPIRRARIPAPQH